ncbi:TetR/AcrR family transcriptional regulator [Crenobacter sp. SG2303]|uniref:TetR/AcrR family transcriptional regulator n=1 Tax=Crenobacter oryzisoli TaxID=3056844 RepID=A0ABT7XKC8_9NEIS|nr:TetR/AcrR family transcriptional regulator [Crenobacter sp. SG2303]MDN0074247.1 TetR/AcrR family transcriptional regulator [Crenobacter sp. SG2303]
MVPNPGRCERESATLRRQQVLDAAADCFRRHGFHSAGMAQIAREAGMSVGHIYHYFENKEAIIAAIVDRDLVRIIEILEGFRNAEDIIKAILNRVAVDIDTHTDARDSALQLEILAESSRNPEVAKITRTKDAIGRKLLGETIENGRRQRGLPPLPATDLDARIDVMIALFEGLNCRGVSHPQLNRDGISAVLDKVLRQLLED